MSLCLGPGHCPHRGRCAMPCQAVPGTALEPLCPQLGLRISHCHPEGFCTAGNNPPNDYL